MILNGLYKKHRTAKKQNETTKAVLVLTIFFLFHISIQKKKKKKIPIKN